MESIILKHTLPKVFAQVKDLKSEVWNQELTFEKNKLYLVEANSGTGKSSLCSYIFGYRKDYEGQILFDGADIARFKTRQWVRIRQKSLSLLWQEPRLYLLLRLMIGQFVLDDNILHRSQFGKQTEFLPQ